MYLIVILSIILLVLSYLKLLSPWNTASNRVGLLLLFISILVFVSTPAMVIDEEPSWLIVPQSPETWLSGSWQENMLTVPVDGSEMRLRVPFYVEHNPVGMSIMGQTQQITFELHNLNHVVENRPFFEVNRGIYYANITNPAGIFSGNNYKNTYDMPVGQYGTFNVDFKINGFANLTAGNVYTVYLTINDAEYNIRFVCV